MQGIIIVDKPQGFTSFDVIAKLRGILKTKKIGHSGTLDPMATGVLPVFVGEAAKAVDMQTNHDKTYVAKILLGVKTNTGDITGEVLQKQDANVSLDLFCSVLKQFEGEQDQMPPMYSAIKIDGQALYKLARKGIEVERRPRTITIYSIKCLQQHSAFEFTFEAKCSKGTYVRTLCEDIGTALGTVATLSELRRTQAGVYTQDNALGFAQIQAAKDNGTVESLLVSVETVFEHLPTCLVTPNQHKRLLCGMPYSIDLPNGDYRLIADVFLGVGTVCDGSLKVKKLFCERK